ncbi:MAG: phage tail protein, partial [Rhodospirillaceae bacterium]|nr:phage tail protein [Rhodospirillales bacterium]
LADGRFGLAPVVKFSWLKATGDDYGRSPVMKALPDIKTANKVVELVLKNATIAVTGIWQADDDGVLNPANIKLVPGTIIPKAVGSAGLQPLEAPGRFDISQLVLEDLRGRIRHALLADKLGQTDAPRMTATEVLERSAEMARLLGATYGRLQSELLTPLVMRAMHILRRRGEIPELTIDGHSIDLQYKSPLAQNQAQRDAKNMLTWLSSLAQLGPAGMQAVDAGAAAKWLGRAFSIPAELMTKAAEGPAAGAPGIDPNALAQLAATLSGGVPQATGGGNGV